MHFYVNVIHNINLLFLEYIPTKIFSVGPDPYQNISSGAQDYVTKLHIKTLVFLHRKQCMFTQIRIDRRCLRTLYKLVITYMKEKQMSEVQHKPQNNTIPMNYQIF